MSLTKYILKESYEKKVSDIIDLFKSKLNYNLNLLPDYIPLSGSGESAYVFEIENTNKVLRIGYPTHASEHDSYNLLLDKNFEHVVKVYMNRKIKDGIHLQVLEKLEPIDKYSKQTLDTLGDEFGDGEVFYNYHELVELEAEYYNDLMDVEKIIIDVQKGIKELESVGITHQDLWSDNIMKDPKTGKYKIIDIS